MSCTYDLTLGVVCVFDFCDCIDYCLVLLLNVGDEGVTPRLLLMGLPGVLEDRRPTELLPGPALAH